MIYDVRLREVIIHEFQVESEDLKSAFLTAIKKAHGNKLKDQPVGRYFEIETLNKGMKNEPINQSKRQNSAIRFKLPGKVHKIKQ